MLSIRCSGKGGQAEECRTLAREVTEIFGEFNISDIIWIFKSFDIQGFNRRFKDIHRRYDSQLENIITNREKLRKEKKESEEKVKDLLDILLDVLENQNSEIKLTRDHIKALFLVSHVSLALFIYLLLLMFLLRLLSYIVFILQLTQN